MLVVGQLSTILVTVNGPWCKYGVWGKVLEGSKLILRDIRIFVNTVKYKLREPVLFQNQAVLLAQTGILLYLTLPLPFTEVGCWS